MPKKDDPRLERAEKRRLKAEAFRQTAMKLAQPSPLPPHPEGLRPSLWPALAFTGAVLLAAWSFLAATIAVGVILAYAIGTRNNPKRQLLYAYIQGRRQFQLGGYETALANFEDMEEAGFTPPAVVRAIGLTNYHLGRWAEAATYLEDLAARTTDEDVALAHAQVELGEFAAAVARLDALENLPSMGVVVRAVSDLRVRKPAEAVRRLEALIADVGGDDAPAMEPYLGARYWLGVSLKEKGDQAGSRRVLEALYGLDPSYLDVATLVGRPGPEDGG